MITAPIIKEHAKKFIGIKYKFGSFDKNIGLDCYSFIQVFFEELGLKIIQKKVTQTTFKTDLNYYLNEFKSNTKEISINEIMDGDVMLFKFKNYASHSGIYIENKILHCTENLGVQYSGFNENWKKRIVIAGRVIG